jgi:hypothetical protein
VDDHPDIILTFKRGLEAENEYSSGKIFFQVYAYDVPHHHQSSSQASIIYC